MIRICFFACILFFTAVVSQAQQPYFLVAPRPNTATVSSEPQEYFLGIYGQSNAGGRTTVSSLPALLQREFQNVYIWVNPSMTPGGGHYEKLQAGVNNQSDPADLIYYGSEIAIADLFETNHPGKVLKIAKMTVGSSAVFNTGDANNWNANVSNNYLEKAINAFHLPARAAITNPYIDFGIQWAQGERDAVLSTTAANAYKANTLDVFAKWRTSLSRPNLKIYVCRVNTYGLNVANGKTVGVNQSDKTGELCDPSLYPNNITHETERYEIFDGSVHYRQLPLGTDIYYEHLFPSENQGLTYNKWVHYYLDRAARDSYTTPSSIVTAALSTLVTGLQTAGIWTKLDVLYVPKLQNASMNGLQYVNLRAPWISATNVGMVETDNGFKGNGSNAYLQTFYIPAYNGVNYAQDNAMRMAWVYTAHTSTFTALDGRTASGTQSMRSTSTVQQRINMVGDLNTAFNFAGTGYTAIDADGLNTAKGFKNSTKFTGTRTSDPPTNTMQVVARSASSYGDAVMAVYGIGSSLTDGQHATFKTLIENYIAAVETVYNIQDVAINYNPAQYIGSNVSITGTPTVTSGGSVTAWKWQFKHSSDTITNASSTSQNPSVSLSTEGFYDIYLTARNSTDKYTRRLQRAFYLFPARFNEGGPGVTTIDMSTGSKFIDCRGVDQKGKKYYIKGQTTNGYLEFAGCASSDPNDPVRIQKANDNTQVTIQFSGGSGKPLYFSQYSHDGNGNPIGGQPTEQGARNIVFNGFNLDGTPGVKVTGISGATTTVRVEGKLTNVAFHGLEVVANPLTIDGAAIAIVPTVTAVCQKNNWSTDNIIVNRCKITAGEEGVYLGESSQSSGYIGNHGFNPPSGIGAVICWNTVLAAGRDGLQVGCIMGEGHDNYVSNWGQQDALSGEAGHQACLVSNDGSGMKWSRNYCINGEYFANIKSGEYPWAPMAGQTTPQPTILEDNIYKSGTYTSPNQEPFAIYMQNNPNSGAGNWTVTIRNNIIDTDKKGAEFLLALGGFNSNNFTLANNIFIKSGTAGDSQEMNVTGNGKATLQTGTKTVNNMVFNQGDNLSALQFTDRSSGNYEPTSTGSSVYSGSPTAITPPYDFFGFPLPLPGPVYFFGVHSLYNKRVIAP